MLSAARQAFFGFVSRVEANIRRAIQQASAPVSAAASDWEPGEPEYTVDGDRAEVRLYGECIPHMYAGYFYPGEAYSDVGVLHVLEKLKGKKVLVRINSIGGDVFGGVAIANYVRERKLNVQVDSIAASIASVIAAAAPRVRMMLGSTVMLHNPWSCACGNAAALRGEAVILDKLRDAMVDMYLAKSSTPTRAGWEAILEGPDGSDGTWWDGHEALALGFADEYEAPEELELPEPKKAALLADRRAAAVANGVALPKNLEELPGRADPQNPDVLKGAPDSQMAPSVRVSHRAGAFRVPR
jgi:ATP-dependent protease ClpP protease subunit